MLLSSQFARCTTLSLRCNETVTAILQTTSVHCTELICNITGTVAAQQRDVQQHDRELQMMVQDLHSMQRCHAKCNVQKYRTNFQLAEPLHELKAIAGTPNIINIRLWVNFDLQLTQVTHLHTKITWIVCETLICYQQRLYRLTTAHNTSLLCILWRHRSVQSTRTH